jgi:hypothetical protein
MKWGVINESNLCSGLAPCKQYRLLLIPYYILILLLKTIRDPIEFDTATGTEFCSPVVLNRIY